MPRSGHFSRPGGIAGRTADLSEQDASGNESQAPVDVRTDGSYTDVTVVWSGPVARSAGRVGWALLPAYSRVRPPAGAVRRP